jgi:hypothetical protein
MSEAEKVDWDNRLPNMTDEDITRLVEILFMADKELAALKMADKTRETEYDDIINSRVKNYEQAFAEVILDKAKFETLTPYLASPNK